MASPKFGPQNHRGEQSRNANRSTLVLGRRQRGPTISSGRTSISAQNQHFDLIALTGGGSVHAPYNERVGAGENLLHRGILKRKRLRVEHAVAHSQFRADVILALAVGLERRRKA